VASEGTERRLAAVLMADVVGYSRLMAEDQDATVRTVTAYREEIELLVRQHRGRLVDFTGDNFLAEFHTALEAVLSAIQIQQVLEVRNSELPSERRMQFRIGVHIGDVAAEGERLFGDGVNIAARLQALAEPGGVCISGNVYDLVHSKLGVGFNDLGTQSVKNIPDPVRVFRVNLEAEIVPPETSPRSWRRAALAVGLVALLGAVAVAGWRMFESGSVAPISAPIRSLAVLPLENLSGDPEQEYFADGMTEALIGDLAKIGSLDVISRTSVMQYKQARKPLPEIAKELNVDGIVEGTVMRAGDRVRITAQLIDARSDRHLWSERYDRELGDILALHSDVARTIAERVSLELDPDTRVALTTSRPVDPTAYDAYLRGLQLEGPVALVATWGPAAIEQFERAVQLDPDFAEGWAKLAQARFLLGIAGFDLRLRKELPRAREAAHRALKVDDRLAVAHATLGSIRLWADWDFAGAHHALVRAVQHGPSNPDVLNSYAVYLAYVGRIEEALTISMRLLRIAPQQLAYRAARATRLFYARQYELALQEFDRIRAVAPSFVDHELVNTYVALGRIEDAYRVYVAFLTQCGPPCAEEREAGERGWAEGGFEEAARAALEVTTRKEGQRPVNIALMWAAIGEMEEALTWLERGYLERDPWMLSLKVRPEFDPLRSDPRFDDLLRRIGFPES
jgi:TolB-like protein/class 3 adenylate cyclase